LTRVLVRLASWLVVVSCGFSFVADGVSPPSLMAAIRYVSLGDSYTIGTSVAESERWPNQLVTAVHDQVPLELVANLGVNGYASGDVIRVELSQLTGFDPDFVTLLIGVNDVVRGVPIDRYSENVEQIITTILGVVPAGRVVIVATPDYTLTPMGASFGDVQQQRAGIDAVNAAMKQAADRQGIDFVDITPVANRVPAEPALVARDGLHPSGAQYAGWVERIAPVVHGLLAP
jgi:lysophospholipase L1-like esterase